MLMLFIEENGTSFAVVESDAIIMASKSVESGFPLCEIFPSYP